VGQRSWAMHNSAWIECPDMNHMSAYPQGSFCCAFVALVCDGGMVRVRVREVGGW
jgi:hypothetical protein